MSINRRELLKAIGAGTAGAAAAVFSGTSAVAAFSAPQSALRYQKYGGHDFKPLSSTTTGWVYHDNGSVYADFPLETGAHQFSTRLQLPQGAEIREVQFNFTSREKTETFKLIAFDLENGFEVLFDSTSITPDANIQTITLAGTPVRVDNAAWNYVLRWFPGGPGDGHILWGARVGYHAGQGEP